MSKHQIRHFLLSGIALFSASPAFAQAQKPTDEAATANGSEIVVTARRKEENIQSVPVAVVAFGQEAIANRMIRSESDLQRVVPGLTIRETEGSNQVAYSIRGQTIDAFTGSALAVVPYINEVQANGNAASGFYDLGSLQVLKGPQGTLFGRNSTGGAVLATTAKPVNRNEGSIGLSYGNYNYVDVKGVANIVLADDKALLRIAGNYTYRDGYQTNVFKGGRNLNPRLGETDRGSGRISLLLKPTGNITNTTVFEYTRTGGNSTSVVPWSVNLPSSTDAVTGLPLATNAAFLYSPALDLAAGPGAWAAYLAAHPGANPDGYAAVVARQKLLGPWQVDVTDQHGKMFFDGTNHYLTNTTTADIADNMTIKNIFGWTKSRSHYNISEQGAPYFVQCTCDPTSNDYGNEEITEAFSNELQLQGKALDGRLDYIVGAFYYHSKSLTHWPQIYFDLNPPFPPSIGFKALYQTRDESKALYTQFTYDLGGAGLEGLSLTGGFRYTWEKVTLDQLPGGNGYNVPGTQNSLTRKDAKPSWTVGLDYKPNTNLLIYAVTRGSWRSGGVNGVGPMRPFTASGGGALFNPETAKDVELGIKWHGDIAGNPAHFNVAAYKEWVKNVQRAEFPVVDFGDGNGPHSIAVTINVPAAEIQGFEVDAGIRPAHWLELGGNLALTDAKYTDNRATIFGNLFVFNPYADTPKWAGTAYGVVHLPIPESAGQLQLRGEVYAQSAQYFSNNDGSITPGTKLPGYALVNMRLDWLRIAGSNISAGAFVSNLTNKAYYVGGLSQGASLGESAAAPGRPRMYGIELKAEF
jgi:iron complex outermembrane receptor protein